MERGLVSARDELLSTRRQVMWTQKDTNTKEMAHLIIKLTPLGQVDDLEKAKEVLEGKIKELNKMVEQKNDDIVALSKEKVAMEQETSAKIVELKVEKEKLVEEQKRVVLKFQKEKENTSRDILMLKKDLEERDEKFKELRLKLKEGEKLLEKKTEELELVRVGQVGGGHNMINILTRGHNISKSVMNYSGLK